MTQTHNWHPSGVDFESEMIELGQHYSDLDLDNDQLPYVEDIFIYFSMFLALSRPCAKAFKIGIEPDSLYCGNHSN